MTPLLDYLPVALILAYLPFMCWSDWKTRTFNFSYLIPLIVVESLLLWRYLAESPARNYYLLGLSAAFCLIPLALAIFGIIGGGDFWLITIIMLFAQYNPFVTPRYWFSSDFFYILLLIICFLPIIVWFYNYRAGNLWGGCVTFNPYNQMMEPVNGYSFVEMLTRFPGGFPLMLPIALAFVLTLVVEVVVHV
jgi:Flp pilus assembly protein protease CpaA